MNVSADAQDVGDVDGSPKLFVNSLGMKMIHVKAKAFDACSSQEGRAPAARVAGPCSIPKPPAVPVEPHYWNNPGRPTLGGSSRR